MYIYIYIHACALLTSFSLHCDSELLNGETKAEHWETSSISSVSDALVIDTRSNSLSSLEDVNGKQRNLESFVVTDTVDYVDSAERNMSSTMAPTGAVDIQITENSPSQIGGSVNRCLVSSICLCLAMRESQKSVHGVR